MQNRVMLICLLMLCANSLSASESTDEPTDEELEQWFESDAFEPEYVDKSSDAQLKFLAPIVDESVPSSSTQIAITADSLRTGWTAIEQCHDALDPVPDAEVVYRFRAMRDLHITESINIERAWVKGQSVQLKNVGRTARLCIKANAQVLYQEADNSYRLRYGPFQRKFLDGYFPYHVSLVVTYPEKMLRLVTSRPNPELGYKLNMERGRLRADAWFTGRLTFEYRFNRR